MLKYMIFKRYSGFPQTIDEEQCVFKQNRLILICMPYEKGRKSRIDFIHKIHLLPERGVVSAKIIKCPFILKLSTKQYRIREYDSVDFGIKSPKTIFLTTQDGNAYRVYDYFFAEWLRKEY